VPRHEIKVMDTVEHGLSLVELLVSMLLGVFLSAVMVSAYLGAKRSYFHEEQVARMQENGRYALRLLSRELGMAGFYGGLLSTEGVVPVSVKTDCSTPRWALDSQKPLELVNDYAGGGAPITVDLTSFTCLDSADIRPGTDMLAIKRTAAEASLRRGIPATALTRSTVQRWYLRLRGGQHPVWEQLRPVDLFDPARKNSNQSYWSAVSRIFFIRKYSSEEGDAIPGLCMEALAGIAMTARCLVQGVENMQLEFGIDTDTDGVANQYKALPAVEDLDRAVTAKIFLLLRSLHPIVGYRDDKSYSLGKQVVPPTGDGYLRKVFSTTVRLPNRMRPLD
jgi:type IV pilus assembly protein PilW